MKLSTFINTHMDSILAEWDAFARTLGSVAAGMTDLALRDHAKQILQAVAEDIESLQSNVQQSRKSKGWNIDERDSAASEHGRIRQENGFTMVQMIAEYRALRAVVLRLWLQKVGQITESTITDMLRFNEGIDQAVAESTARYMEQAGRTRDTFLAILGHDLRNPLAAMLVAGEYLAVPNLDADKIAQLGGQVRRSAAAMGGMVNDLLEYARTQLGGGIPVARHDADVQDICKAAIDEVAMANPGCGLELKLSGDLSGSFDSARLQQALINLLTNAVQYRSDEHPVRVVAAEEEGTIVIHVQNRGPVIPQDALQAIFNPLVQLANEGHYKGRPSTSLGLGLFIAREITEAHDGTISAESSQSYGTVFTIRIPKMAAR